MVTTTITVEGMTCEHCVNAVKGEISQLPGVSDLSIELDSGLVTIKSESDLDSAALAAAVDEAGYAIV